MLIDTHCHLDAAEFDADRDEAIARSQAVGVRTVLVPAIDRGNFGTVRSLTHRFDGGCYALGIHPLFVPGSHEADLDALRAAVEVAMDDPRFVAIGEIGLDHFVPGQDLARQERFYEAQLRLARDFDLPVLLHVRRAQDHVLKHLRRLRPAGGIAHAFNGSEQQARHFLGLGFALGFGGAMTFGRALQIRRLATGLPAEAHVLETDAPDISPAWLHPARNEPAELVGIARALAELRGIDPEEVATASAGNALRVLPRLATVPGSRPFPASSSTPT